MPPLSTKNRKRSKSDEVPASAAAIPIKVVQMYPLRREAAGIAFSKTSKYSNTVQFSKVKQKVRGQHSKDSFLSDPVLRKERASASHKNEKKTQSTLVLEPSTESTSQSVAVGDMFKHLLTRNMRASNVRVPSPGRSKSRERDRGRAKSAPSGEGNCRGGMGASSGGRLSTCTEKFISLQIRTICPDKRNK
jgi:hypothetical protein